MSPVPSRDSLWRWCGWFLTGNIVLAWLAGWHYVPAAFPAGVPSEFDLLSSTHQSVLTGFLFFSYVGYLGCLAIIPFFLVAPLLVVWPQRSLIFSVTIIAATVVIVLLIFDTVTFSLYRFHLNGIVLTLALTGLRENILGLSPREIIFAGGVICVITGIELLLAWTAWQLQQRARAQWVPICVGLGVSFCCYLSFLCVFYSADYENANDNMHKAFVDSARFLPFYYQVIGDVNAVFATDFQHKKGGLLVQANNAAFVNQPTQAMAPLHYPTADSVLAVPAHRQNIVVIAIDAWRYDLLAAENTPALWQFAKRSQVFQQHWSGGNATGPGIFSLFYSLPNTYWTAMATQQRGPLWLDNLLRQHYQFGIFASATLRLPPFDQTVFRAVPHLQGMSGNTAYARDTAVTQAFQQFVVQTEKNARPFFSFLFYDGVHSYCDYDEDLQPLQPVIAVCERAALTPASDPTPYLNRYKNALLLVDKQVQTVLATLEHHHLLQNTIVVITADHGEEFNDNRLGFWGHASNFTQYQLRVPLIIYWPGMFPHVYTHQTTHYDIVPTIMTAMHQSVSPTSYSLGKNLFDAKTKLPYFIAGSYVGFGVIEPDRITSIYAQGDFEIQTLTALPELNAEPHLKTMRHVFSDLQRFYLTSVQ